MDLSTTYLGMKLAHPLVVGASPLVDDLDMVRRLEDAGAAAIVMHSLFEEQIEGERRAVERHMEAHDEGFAEALTFFPAVSEYPLGPEHYLEHLGRVKAAVKVPVIGSLNGTTPAGWLDHAGRIESAGADALELNVYHVATDPREKGAAFEARIVEIVRAVRGKVKIPIAVKLSPFFSALPELAVRLVEAGANGLVLFNRFYQPNIDLEAIEVVPALKLSAPSELLVRLRWLAILSGRVQASLAATGGVHTAEDALKAVMAGAHAVQIVSALLRNGPEHLRAVREGMEAWLEEHEYGSLGESLGSMSLARCPDPAAFERGNYLKILHSWRG